MKNNLKAFALGVSLSIALIGAYALAVSIPNLFNAGEAINASKMNANFAAVKTAIDALEQKVTTLESAKVGVNSKGTVRAFVISSGVGVVSNQYSSTGGNVTVTSNGTGSYAVTIPGLNFSLGDHLAVVTPLSDNNNACYPASYGNPSVSVRCYGDTGSSINTGFSLLVFNK